eukprot:TRINITY_DN22050_c0_g2_i10.p1 TRINITY_DN22050_c0_g2~~TRINITY_DN22050_c0_g2_i10.p1  ORF type:complete len:1321 (+),score=245.10 TRINITY_DN22050_c0_g2_i10:91-3963(+)
MNCRAASEASVSHRDFRAPAPDAYLAAREIGLSPGAAWPAGRQADEDCDGRGSARRAHFEALSTYHRDFPPPPLDALLAAFPPTVQPVAVDSPTAPVPPPYAAMSPSYWQSVTHKDFDKPPADAYMASGVTGGTPNDSSAAPFADDSGLRPKEVPAQTWHGRQPLSTSALQSVEGPSRFDGRSSMRGDYKPLPLDALRAALQSNHDFIADALKHESDVRFEGESTARSHYKAPPAEALRLAFGPVIRVCDRGAASFSEPIKFEGQSRTRSDFVAPPTSVLKEALSAQPVGEPSRWLAESADKENVPFQGLSSYRQDFLPPPADALADAFELPLGERYAANTVQEAPCRFEGESSSRRDYQALPLDALRDSFRYNVRRQEAADAQSKQSHDIVSIPGESQRLWEPHAAEALPPPSKAASGGSLLDAYRRGAVRASSSVLGRFEGQSSMRADFRPPPREVLLQAAAASQVARPSSLPASARSTSRFEGQSTSRMDFQAPPREALEQAMQPLSVALVPRAASAEPRRFEGESSSRAAYRPPPTECLLAATRLAEARAAHAAFEAASSPRRRQTAFEAESQTRRDFVAPPASAYLDVMKSAMASARPQRPPDMAASEVAEMVSSMRRDFPAPPTAALLESLQIPRIRTTASQVLGAREQHEFEGESSMRRDYLPPQTEVLLAAHQVPPLRALQGSSPALSTRGRGHFEGESTTRRDFVPPSMENLLDALREPRPVAGWRSSSALLTGSSKFEGESSMKRDFPPHSTRDLVRAVQAPSSSRGAQQRPSLSTAALRRPALAELAGGMSPAAAPSQTSADTPRSAAEHRAKVPASEGGQALVEAAAAREARASAGVAMTASGSASEASAAPSRHDAAAEAAAKAPLPATPVQRGTSPASRRPPSIAGWLQSSEPWTSSLHQAYRPPPLDAYQQAYRARLSPVGGGSAGSSARARSEDISRQKRAPARFEGESFLHRDFQAPSRQALLAAFQPYGGPGPVRADRSSTPVATPGKGSDRSDHDAPRVPPLNFQDVHAAATQARPAGRSSHRALAGDAEARSILGLASSRSNVRARSADSAATTAQRDFVAPAAHAFRVPRRLCKPDQEPLQFGTGAGRFNGESSAHRDYRPPPPGNRPQPGARRHYREGALMGAKVRSERAFEDLSALEAGAKAASQRPAGAARGAGSAAENFSATFTFRPPADSGNGGDHGSKAADKVHSGSRSGAAHPGNSEETGRSSIVAMTAAAADSPAASVRSGSSRRDTPASGVTSTPAKGTADVCRPWLAPAAGIPSTFRVR